MIALAQHLVVHFSEHDLASLAKTSTERAVADMKFGDRRDCDRMVERIREKIEELKQQKTFADQVKRRADLLLAEVKYRNDTDSVPSVGMLQMISRVPGHRSVELDLARRSSDAPLRINVVADDYWDLSGRDALTAVLTAPGLRASAISATISSAACAHAGSLATT